jgi:class 3 adenylate cyclase
MVNAAFVAVWAMSANDARRITAAVLEGNFWPGWIMLITVAPLAIHALYVFARRPMAELDARGVGPMAPGRGMATVLFTDIVGSTERARAIGDRRWGEILDRHDRLAGRAVDNHGGRVIKRTGDGILALFDDPGSAIQGALECRDLLHREGLLIRAGLHIGEVNRRDRGQDVGVIAVHIAARVMAVAGPGEVVVTTTVHDLEQGSDIPLQDRSMHSLEGIGDGWQLLAVGDREGVMVVP